MNNEQVGLGVDISFKYGNHVRGHNQGRQSRCTSMDIGTLTGGTLIGTGDCD